MQSLYYGFSTTHPHVFAFYNIWDSLDSHHELQHSPEYIPIVQAATPLLAGRIRFVHIEILTDAGQLKTGLESPTTQTAIIPLALDKVASYLKWWSAKAPKHLTTVAAKMRSLWAGYPYEDP
jgi:hypothetical protein